MMENSWETDSYPLGAPQSMVVVCSGLAHKYAQPKPQKWCQANQRWRLETCLVGTY